MPIDFPAGAEPERRSSTYPYHSHAWANRLIQLLKQWNTGGREDRFVPSRANGLSATTMRAAFYAARSFINNPAHKYSQEDIDLVNSARFRITDHPSEGLIIMNTIADTFVSAPAKPQDEEAVILQEIFSWCGVAHKNGECREWTGMFSVTLRKRVEEFLRQLIGAYLGKITPTSIKVIAWESGSTLSDTPAPAPVVDNKTQTDPYAGF